MNRLQASLSLSLFSVAALTGCSGFGAASFPDASANPAQIPLGSISGSDFGGHAPLVGAHVYVLQPSVTTATATSTQTAVANAYAGRASSLLTASYSNNGSAFPATIQNASDPGIPNSWYYLQTDQTGAFNITGDYTCTAGVPVYLYLYGGSPTYPSGSTTATNTFNIASYTVSGSSGAYTVTMTITTTGQYATNPIENAYIGEGFTIASATGANPSGQPFNGSFQLVTAPNLTTTTFSFTYASQTLPTGITTGTTYTQTGTNMQVTFEPTFNPGVVNLAVLGNCPSSGSFTGANKISYVYVNEVSTVAAAYAFRPFTFTPLTGTQGYQTDCATAYVTNISTQATTTYDWNNATCIGTSSSNLAGLQNAANLAGQLYDITGSNLSTTYAGEGHIARSATTAGNGIVPQANIDTIANILAACVDSNNGATLVGSTGGYNNTTQGAYQAISPQCNTLFTAATSNGIPIGGTGAGIQPFDIAQAAINIARYPAGPTYSYSTSGSTTFVNNLYTLPNAGNRPFEPDLLSTGAGQPNDFSLAIYYTNSNNPGTQTGTALTNGAESLAIDKIGNVWFTTQPNKGTGAGYFFELSPVGIASNIQYQGSYIYGYVTIDSGNTPWTGTQGNSKAAVAYVQNTGLSTTSTAYPTPYTYSAGTTNSKLLEYGTTAAVASYNGNVFFGNQGTGGSSIDYVMSLSGAASTPTVTPTESAAIPTLSTDGNTLSHGAMYFGGANAYFDYNAANGAGTPYVDYVSLSTTSGYTPVNGSGFPVTNSTTGCTAMLDPEQLATLRSGDVIVPDYHNGSGGSTSALYYITSPAGAGTAGSATGPGGCTQIPESTFHAGLNYPFGSAVDGNDFIYVTNRGGNSISIFNAQTAGAANLASVSPSTGIVPQYVVGSTLTNMLNQPLNIATGPEGTIWISDYGNNTITEIIGLAYPTTTPLGNAAIPTPVPYTSGSIGYRP